MPQSNSAKKRVRQTVTRTLRNRQRASAMKTAMRRVDEAVESGDAETLKKAVEGAYSRIDKAAMTNVIHANTAARRKALVMRKATNSAK